MDRSGHYSCIGTSLGFVNEQDPAFQDATLVLICLGRDIGKQRPITKSLKHADPVNFELSLTVYALLSLSYHLHLKHMSRD